MRIPRLVMRLCEGIMHHERARDFLLSMGDERGSRLVVPRPLKIDILRWAGIFPFAPQTILDVGAHKGNFSLSVANAYRPHFCGLVEPHPGLAETLRQLSLPCESRVFCCALGATPDCARFHILENVASSSLLTVNPVAQDLFRMPMEEKQTIETPVRTLDEVFAECGQERVDLLKVDVQGYELEVFAGGERTLEGTRMILAEVSFFEHYLDQPQSHQVIEYLHHRGFRLRGTSNYYLSQAGTPLQCDALFVKEAG